MTDPITTPTIAELWRKFQLSCKDVAFYRQLNGTLQSIEAKKIAAAEANFTALRAQLIERCKRVHDVDGFTSMFEIEERNGQLGISVYFQDRRGYSSRHPRCDDANTAKEYAAAYAFWVWELDQCQREATSTAATTQQQP